MVSVARAHSTDMLWLGSRVLVAIGLACHWVCVVSVVPRYVRRRIVSYTIGGGDTASTGHNESGDAHCGSAACRAPVEYWKRVSSSLDLIPGGLTYNTCILPPKHPLPPQKAMNKGKNSRSSTTRY